MNELVRKLLNKEPEARHVTIIVIKGFIDHLDMKKLLKPLLGAEYNREAVEAALD